MREMFLLARRSLVLLCFIPLFTVAEMPDAYATCVGCHGAQGEGSPTVNAPALAGQSASYLNRQLQNFKTGQRGTAEGDTTGAQMTAFANMLSDADIAAISQALSALPAVSRPATLNGDVQKGQKIYNANCGDCHGAFAEGNESFSAPKLVGQHDQYLADQILKFQNGQRGYEKADRLGRQMAFMSSEIGDDQALRDVIAYIQSLEVAGE